MDRALGLFSCPGIRSERSILISFSTGENRIPPAQDPSRRIPPDRDPSLGTPHQRDSSRNGIAPKAGFLPELEGNFFFREEFRFGRNFVSGGIPFWEESCYGRNPVMGGIPFWEESSFGRNPVLGGVPQEGSWVGGVPREGSWRAEFPGRNPAWEEFQGHRNFYPHFSISPNLSHKKYNVIVIINIFRSTVET